MEETGVASSLSYERVAWFMETGGLLLLFVSLLVIVYGFVQGAREVGGRTIGYGFAMAAASGLALYGSVQLGRDPMQAATESTWLYSVVAVIACLLWASSIVNKAQTGHGKRRVGRRGDEFSNDDVTQPRTSPRGRAGQVARVTRR